MIRALTLLMALAGVGASADCPALTAADTLGTWHTEILRVRESVGETPARPRDEIDPQTAPLPAEFVIEAGEGRALLTFAPHIPMALARFPAGAKYLPADADALALVNAAFALRSLSAPLEGCAPAAIPSWVLFPLEPEERNAHAGFAYGLDEDMLVVTLVDLSKVEGTGDYLVREWLVLLERTLKVS